MFNVCDVVSDVADIVWSQCSTMRMMDIWNMHIHTMNSGLWHAMATIPGEGKMILYRLFCDSLLLFGCHRSTVCVSASPVNLPWKRRTSNKLLQNFCCIFEFVYVQFDSHQRASVSTKLPNIPSSFPLLFSLLSHGNRFSSHSITFIHISARTAICKWSFFHLPPVMPSSSRARVWNLLPDQKCSSTWQIWWATSDTSVFLLLA